MTILDSGSRSLGVVLGLAAITLAGAVAGSSLQPSEVGGWALRVFGASFLLLLSGLIFLVAFSWIEILRHRHDPDSRALWLETGQHAAGGISTLALTYTLLGISLGIGELAGRELTPQTVQEVIRDLTAHFSMAFLTTVIGLPVSAAARAVLGITAIRTQAGVAQVPAIRQEAGR